MKPRRFTSRILGLSIALYTLFVIILVSITYNQEQVWKPYGVVGAVGLLGGNLILWLGLRSITDPFDKERQSIERLNNTLLRKTYEDRHKIESLERFAPIEFEALLLKKRGEVLEIGELQEAAGTLGAVSFASDAKRKDKHIDYHYVHAVNKLLKRMPETAISLPDSSNLQSMMLIYKEFVQEAVDCTVKAFAEFYAEKCEEASEESNIKPVMVMHRTPYWGGLAGTEQWAFPFIEAPEMRQLIAYTGQFRSCNVGLVLTGDILAYLEVLPKVRYVGDIPVVAEAKVYQKKIKLFEVLEVYSHQEQAIKQSTEDAFQKALALYLTKDYYLARNAFTEVLKKNPADGVAKWYLFACEKNLTM